MTVILTRSTVQLPGPTDADRSPYFDCGIQIPRKSRYKGDLEMSDDPKPRADHVPANTSDELSDELRPSEQEQISGGSFLDPGGIKGESTRPSGGG